MAAPPGASVVTVIRGKRVARTPDGTRHIADRAGEAIVLALCGNTLVRPATVGLTGTPCLTCDRIAAAKAAGE